MIVEAAILQNGIIYTGKRHHLIIANMIKIGIKKPINGEQGFITDKNEFVNRKDAARIALSCGQIKELKFSTVDLFSEDLY